VLGAVPPGQLRPSMLKGNAQLTSRETLSFGTLEPAAMRLFTFSAHQPLYEAVLPHLAFDLRRLTAR
jgi:hypothetical protein